MDHPNSVVTSCTSTDHSWAPGPGEVDGRRFLICERCAATVPPPVVEPGVQLVEVEADEDH